MSGRLLVLLGAAQLVVSSALLAWASLSPRLVPLWARVLDVTIAFLLVYTAAVLRACAEQAPPAHRLTELRRALLVNSTVPSVVLLGAWLLRDRIDWNILLPGLAWRLFITLYGMSSALTAWRREELPVQR